MSSGLPVAVISGIEKFGAKKLADKLAESDIRVIGVSQFDGGFAEEMNEVDYVFDFDENELAWKLAAERKARLTVIGVNENIQKRGDLMVLDVNWRILNFHGVYGEGMPTTNEAAMGSEELGWLVKAMRQSVRNENLVLPNRGLKLRLLADTDMTEAVMRGSFLSGTEGETFDVWGSEIGSEEIAKVLVDEAKMTRFKVIEDGVVEAAPMSDYVEEVWNRLRWKPEAELAVSIRTALQEIFAKVDEEGRKKKSLPKTLVDQPKLNIKKNFEKVEVEAKIKPEKRFEVEVEEVRPSVNYQLHVSNEEVVADKVVVNEKEELSKIIEEEYKDVVEEAEPKIEIKPLLVKNSNLRAVQSIEEEVPKAMVIAPKVEKRVEKKIEIQPKVVQKKPINLGWMKWGWGVLGAGWLVVIVTVIMWLATNYGIYKNISGLKKLINDKKYVEASEVVSKTLMSVRKQETSVENWGINQWIWGRRYQEVLKVAEQGMLLSQRAVSISKRLDLINSGIFLDKDINWNTELKGLQIDLEGLSDNLGLVGGRLAGDWKWIPERWDGSFDDVKKQLEEASKLVEVGRKAVAVLPEFLGTDGKRREYMVLLQNESELRPNGGFIGSYGILSFEGGKLRNFDIKDIYEADGQLKGHVEPPEPIKTFLGEAKWYMRDANWQADFGASSKDIQWFLEKETGRKVDGVIGVNLAVARGILGVLGEVYVPDFKEKINSGNLYEQAEFYSETNSFPGSVQKASFLGGLGKQLFEEIKNIKGEKRIKLVQTLIELAQKNEIQLSLNNQAAAGIMAGLGWNGGLYEGKCVDSNCFADYLYLLEANVGVNKANYFLYRNVDQVVDIGLQSISRVVKISYENISKSTAWPGGDYKNYLRVYIPESSNLAEVSVTDKSKDGIKTIYSGDSLRVNVVRGRKEVGFLVTVPVGTKRVVELRYVDQIDLTNRERFSYLHYIQKQSGFGDTGMVTLVSMPTGWQVNQAEPTATLVNEKLLFNQKLDRDIKMGVEIVK